MSLAAWQPEADYITPNPTFWSSLGSTAHHDTRYDQGYDDIRQLCRTYDVSQDYQLPVSRYSRPSSENVWHASTMTASSLADNVG